MTQTSQVVLYLRTIICESLSDITLSRYEAEYDRHIPDAIHQHPSDNLICLLRYMLRLVGRTASWRMLAGYQRHRGGLPRTCRVHGSASNPREVRCFSVAIE